MSIAAQQDAKKFSRFSDLCKYLNLYPPKIASMAPPEPVKKKKFVWTDANENDLKDFYLKEKRAHIDENQPALIFGNSTTSLEGLNPALLSAL